jgi:SAM-dependent methyltransferase
MKADTPECPACDATGAFAIEGQPEDYEYRVTPPVELRVYACTACGTNYLWPRLNADEIAALYPSDYHAYNEDHGLVAQILVYMRDTIRRKRYTKIQDSHPIRIFDVGSGDCRHFEALRRKGGFSFAGVEINPEMARRAVENGYDVRQGVLEDMDLTGWEGSFDIVTMYQLVEHVADPRKLFQQARRLLRPGGTVLGQLPCIESIEAKIFGKYFAGYHYPRHLQAFSRRGLVEAIEAGGLGVESIGSSPHLQAGISLQNLIVDHFPPKRRLQYGKVPFYSLLLVSVAPFCLIEHLLGRGGMMFFSARRPQASAS